MKVVSSLPPAQGEMMQDDWVLPLVHGFFRQRCLEFKGGQILRLTLIARRSRHHAGTRFLRRGINALGYVANEVESEQILSLDPDPITGICAACSFVQVRPPPSPPLHSSATFSESSKDITITVCFPQLRGSIPLFWSHTNIMSPKPDIYVQQETDPNRTATRTHFER